MKKSTINNAVKFFITGKSNNQTLNSINKTLHTINGVIALGSAAAMMADYISDNDRQTKFERAISAQKRAEWDVKDCLDELTHKALTNCKENHLVASIYLTNSIYDPKTGSKISKFEYFGFENKQEDITAWVDVIAKKLKAYQYEGKIVIGTYSNGAAIGDISWSGNFTNRDEVINKLFPETVKKSLPEAKRCSLSDEEFDKARTSVLSIQDYKLNRIKAIRAAVTVPPQFNADLSSATAAAKLNIMKEFRSVMNALSENKILTGEAYEEAIATASSNADDIVYDYVKKVNELISGTGSEPVTDTTNE